VLGTMTGTTKRARKGSVAFYKARAGAMMAANEKVSAGLIVFLLMATAGAILAILRPHVIHRFTSEAYTRDPWRRIKPLADVHRGRNAVARIRLSGIVLLVIVVWVTSLIIKNQ
jgi:hypothetical protein